MDSLNGTIDFFTSPFFKKRGSSMFAPNRAPASPDEFPVFLYMRAVLLACWVFFGGAEFSTAVKRL